MRRRQMANRKWQIADSKADVLRGPIIPSFQYSSVPPFPGPFAGSGRPSMRNKANSRDRDGFGAALLAVTTRRGASRQTKPIAGRAGRDPGSDHAKQSQSGRPRRPPLPIGDFGLRIRGSGRVVPEQEMSNKANCPPRRGKPRAGVRNKANFGLAPAGAAGLLSKTKPIPAGHRMQNKANLPGTGGTATSLQENGCDESFSKRALQNKANFVASWPSWASGSCGRCGQVRARRGVPVPSVWHRRRLPCMIPLRYDPRAGRPVSGRGWETL